MGYNKGLHNGGSQRGRSYYLLILLMTFGAALLGVMVLHRFRERRIYTLLFKEKDHQLLALQVLLQKEIDHSKELSRKNEETKAKIYTLSNQKMELARTIAEMKSTMNSLKDEQKLIESVFEEKQKELRMMQKRGINLGQGRSERLSSRENLKKKEAELEDVKYRISIDDHPSIFDRILATNATMEAQNKTQNDNQAKEVDEGKSKLTELKDGEVTGEKQNEDIREDGVAAKDDKVVEDKKSIEEEQQKKLESNIDGVKQDFNVRQLSGTDRKHGRRTTGTRWKTIVKNKLMENNGIFENHEEVNMGTTKVYKEDNEGIVGRYSDEESDGNNQREAKSHARSMKPENHETREEGNNTTLDETNHHLTNNGINNYQEENEDGIVQQNWSMRHINDASKNAEQTKDTRFLENPNEFEVSDVQEKDAIDVGDNGEEDNSDDFFNESQPDFEDENEKEEYKEEIDDSEFQRSS